MSEIPTDLRSEFDRRFDTPVRRRAALLVLDMLVNAVDGVTDAEIDSMLQENFTPAELAELDATPGGRP